MLADTQRGSAWLGMLRPSPPEPSTLLLGRILAQTSVLRAKADEAARADRRAAKEAALLLGRPIAVNQPVTPAFAEDASTTRVLPFRDRLQGRLHLLQTTMLQPRFAMTAAMAFFSIALTLNLTGVRVSDFRASDLKPANVKRGVYETRARMVRYYANLRVVYELESRVRDLQRSNESNDPAPAERPVPATPAPAPSDKAPEQKPAKPRPKPNSGTSRWESPGKTPGLVRHEATRQSTSAAVVAVSLKHAAALSQGRGSV